GNAIEYRTRRRSTGRHALSSPGKACCNRGIIIRAIVAKSGSGLLGLRFGGHQILVRNINLQTQFFKLRIFEDRPPVAAKILVIGLGRLPVRCFFIRGRSVYRWRMVVRTDRASSSDDDESKKSLQTKRFHPVFEENIFSME